MSDRFMNAEESVASPTDRLQQELLELLLHEETYYPWNPADPEADAYFDRAEEEFDRAFTSELEATALDSEQLLSCIDLAIASWETCQVRKSLIERFGACVPHDWLEAIATRARSMISRSLSPADQLVSCVRPLLSNWAEEDLYVFARPMTHAMRSGIPPETESVLWEQLSAIEQARYTLKIARYALGTLDSELGS